VKGVANVSKRGALLQQRITEGLTDGCWCRRV